MMRCIAVDDEKLALDLLEDNIKRLPFLQLVKRCKTPLEASKVLSEEPVDLIFLDIQMPGLSGLQFLEVTPVRPLVIMITAYEKYALEGFNYDVVDYLVKPVSFERFLKACNKAYELFQLKKQQTDSVGRDYIFVNVEYNQVKVNFDDITFIEGMKDYVKIHLQSVQRPVITRLSMKAVEEKLPSTLFMRIHKSYIISVKKITAIKRGLVQIDKIEIPLSDSYKHGLEQLLGITTE